MTFELFDENIGVQKNKWHTKVQFLNNDQTLFREREIIKKWTDGLIDKDNKMIIEFQTTFHSCFWEFYLYALFRSIPLKQEQALKSHVQMHKYLWVYF